jgi:hypothetical protein
VGVDIQYLTKNMSLVEVVWVAVAVGAGVVGAVAVGTIRLAVGGTVVTLQVGAVFFTHLVGAVVGTAVYVEAAAEEVMVVVAPIVRLRVPVPAPAVPGEYRDDQYFPNFSK